MNPQDNPHFTAYALGELSAEEARDMHELLATTPAAAHELEQIEAVTDALRHGAPIPLSRLTHEQRHAVLHPSNLPRRIQPMLPRKPSQRSHQTFWPVMGTLVKAAAVIALSGAAFLAGWSFGPAVQSAAQMAATPPKAEPLPEAVKPQPVVEKAAPAPLVAVKPAKAEPKASETPKPVAEKMVGEVKPVSAPAPLPAAVPAATPVPAAKEKEEVMVASAAPVKEKEKETPAVAGGAAPNLGFSLPTGHGTFVSTTKQAADQFSLHPGQVKPLPQKGKGQGQMFASPQTVPVKPEPKTERHADLYIHSWKAEVAACPWNTANRLLRIVIQLPADQAAVLATGASFPMQIAFDQANVKQYRMLCERHLAAPELRSAGTHVLWYEFQPNGSGEIPRDSSRQIATVTLANTHFTSQAVGPFDSSKLQVIDRGYSLQNAREDFVFETSVVGFGLLLRGADHLGVLNHDLVLNLAKQSKGADPHGERARFIHLVQDARQAAGL
ncbi:YfbK domain-containing protein [Prosthecobacter sp.]|uniref:YfbK domain-containing protein n=1 Tax=Prosthecobacter sp. TaxID=1965333 RepID=UPI0037850711